MRRLSSHQFVTPDAHPAPAMSRPSPPLHVLLLFPSTSSPKIKVAGRCKFYVQKKFLHCFVESKTRQWDMKEDLESENVGASSDTSGVLFLPLLSEVLPPKFSVHFI